MPGPPMARVFPLRHAETAAPDRFHGESYSQLRDRASPAFTSLAVRHRGETIIEVAHGVVIRVLLTSLLEGRGPRDFDRIGIDFVAVTDLRFDGHQWAGVDYSTPWLGSPVPAAS